MEKDNFTNLQRSDLIENLKLFTGNYMFKRTVRYKEHEQKLLLG